jgi:hypothetical protein
MIVRVRNCYIATRPLCINSTSACSCSGLFISCDALDHDHSGLIPSALLPSLVSANATMHRASEVPTRRTFADTTMKAPAHSRNGPSSHRSCHNPWQHSQAHHHRAHPSITASTNRCFAAAASPPTNQHTSLTHLTRCLQHQFVLQLHPHRAGVACGPHWSPSASAPQPTRPLLKRSTANRTQR